MSRKKYALHPGWITASDGDQHFIGAARIAELYGLRIGEWFEWNDRTSVGRRFDDYEHLYPGYDYTMPAKKG